jgi:hypothetical protein
MGFTSFVKIRLYAESPFARGTFWTNFRLQGSYSETAFVEMQSVRPLIVKRLTAGGLLDPNRFGELRGR